MPFVKGITVYRYCTHCKKEYDFPPRAITAKEPLICPTCGNIIEKNSRDPEHGKEAEKSEETIGRAFGTLFHLSYIFYITLAIAGAIGFVTGFYILLYVTVAISLISYGIQLMIGMTTFPSGVIFLPIGGVLGYVIFKKPEGIWLGVHAVFFLRHLIRDIFYRFIFWIIRKCSEC